jgi:hypothetical protein
MYHTRYDTYILTSNFPGCSFFLAVSLLAERGKLTGSQRVLNLPWREKVMLPGDLFASFRVGCREGNAREHAIGCQKRRRQLGPGMA